ncbi:hypothetical protein K6L44_11535 [Gluconacetobacter entanii]|uniref:hypothetical protein n=1 Tax=Gluconacetobacter entanii TaxID=108528 RepID=UPI001C9359BB|nr:hypothetical protein [Gluconacetobacter entanii]MBY4640606.1 hypothetical protein [Gluconacetobacter entanii]MCW4578951.1 hypothetical protein [Gluconacetobacter entanii]MCW4585738.1 hypothetical protein [Gluconacetobacter entanii]
MTSEKFSEWFISSIGSLTKNDETGVYNILFINKRMDDDFLSIKSLKDLSSVAGNPRSVLVKSALENLWNEYLYQIEWRRADELLNASK